MARERVPSFPRAEKEEIVYSCTATGEVVLLSRWAVTAVRGTHKGQGRESKVDDDRETRKKKVKTNPNERRKVA